MKINLFKKSNRGKLFVCLSYCSLIYGVYLCAVNHNWWPLLISFLIYNWHGVFGNNCAMHRLYSHKSFTTGPIRKLWLLIESVLWGGGIGPITYAAVHRAHHAFSDTDKDPHSPHKYHPLYIGLGLYIFRRDDDQANTGIKLPKDLMRDKSLRFTEVHYHTLWLVGSLIIWALFGFSVLLYGFLVPSCMSIIAANTIGNVFNHSNLPFSYKNYNTNDKSVNNKIIQVLLKGEGLHNNHHHDQNALNQAFKKGEFDPTWYVLKWIFLDKETIAKHEKNL